MPAAYPIIPGLNDGQPGRPSAINDTYDVRPDGTTRTRHQAIIDHIEQSGYFETACALTGTPVRTGRRWLIDGARAEAGPQDKLTEYQTTCITFRNAYLTAQANREQGYLTQADELIRGGRRIAKVRVKRRFTSPQDTEGIVIERIEETSVLPPDADLLKWRLAVGNPARFGQKITVQQVDEFDLPEDELRDAVADKLEAYLAGVADTEAQADTGSEA